EAEQEVLEPAPVETEAPPPEEAAPADEATDLSVMLRGRVAIFPDQPLPAYSSKHAVAFHAQIRTDPMRPLMALLCEPDMPARVDYMEWMRSYQLQGMVQTAEWGLVDWPGESRRRFVIVCDRPAGTRVMPSLDTPQAPLSEDDLINGLLTPLLPTLK